jgi:hypothetical protein
MQIVDRYGIVHGVDRIQINSIDGREKPSTTNYGLFTQTAKSVPVTNSTTEQSLIYVNFEQRVNDGGGVTESMSCMDSELRNYGSVGSLTVPANGFRVGDSFHAVLTGHISSVNNHTLHIRIKTDGVALADTGVITMPATTLKHWKLDINFTIRAIGPSGVASIASGGTFFYTKNASNALEGTNFSTETTTGFDTTISNTLEVTAQWGTASTGDSIYSEIFTLNKIF